MRIIAIDWSGDKKKSRDKIWMASSAEDEVSEVRRGLDYSEMEMELIALADKDPELIIGLDFTFSMPEWFVESCGVTNGRDFWNVVSTQGDLWLKNCSHPFWGPAGSKKPTDVELLRRTEARFNYANAPKPKSVFQIAGAGAVGTGSIRGIPMLARLAEAGFRIWPFHSPEAGRPLVVEIYPRWIFGSVVNTNPAERQKYLAERASCFSDQVRTVAETVDDAFDAAVSAAAMRQHEGDFLQLQLGDEVDQSEGAIWFPTMLKPEEGGLISPD